MEDIRFIVKKVESCVTCEYSESNYNLDIFHCKKYDLDLTENKDKKFHKDCRLLDPNYIICEKEDIQICQLLIY